MSHIQSDEQPEQGGSLVPAAETAGMLNIGALTLPPESSIRAERQKTGDEYAAELYELTSRQLVMHQEMALLQTENAELKALYDRLQAKRKEDRNRASLISRKCDALEGNSTAQALRTKLAQRAMKEAELGRASAEEDAKQSALAMSEFDKQVKHLQASYIQLEEALALRDYVISERDREVLILSNHADWAKAHSDLQEARIADLTEELDGNKRHSAWQETAIRERDAYILQLEADLAEQKAAVGQRDGEIELIQQHSRWQDAVIAERDSEIARLSKR